MFYEESNSTLTCINSSLPQLILDSHNFITLILCIVHFHTVQFPSNSITISSFKHQDLICVPFFIFFPFLCLSHGRTSFFVYSVCCKCCNCKAVIPKFHTWHSQQTDQTHFSYHIIPSNSKLKSPLITICPESSKIRH